MLNATPNSDIYLNCGDIPMYTGRMGRRGDRIAIQIGDRVSKTPDNQI